MASKVLYVEQLPSHWTEDRLRAELAPFGDARKIVLLRKRNAIYAGYNPSTLEPIRATTIQALVEVADVDAAAHMLERLEQTPLVVDDGARRVTASYSKNQELRERHAVTSDRHHLHHHPLGESNRILLVTVQNPTYPITTDLMHGVFSTYGDVEKIVIFVKPVGLQFASLEEAISAKHALNGLSVFPDCCGLVIHFSNLPQELIVKENGQRTKDFVNTALPTPVNDSAVNSGNDMHMHAPTPIYGYAAPVAAVSASMVAAAGHHHAHAHLHAHAAHHHGLPHMHMHHPHHHHQPPPQHHLSPAGALLPPPIVPGIGREVVSPVLLVCNLRESVTCDHLFNLFSCYGNVARVKKLAAKSDHALVQFSNQLAAQSALVHLRGFTLLGRSLEISYSKHAYIAIRPLTTTTTNITTANGGGGGGIVPGSAPPCETTGENETATTAMASASATTSPPATAVDEPWLMKEYGHSVNRFTGKYANGTKHIYSPTKIVHVSNLDETATAEQLREHLSSFPGGEHCKVKLFTNSNGHIQALAEFPSVDAATNVLAQAHNAPLGPRRLKLAFSRKTLHN